MGRRDFGPGADQHAIIHIETATKLPAASAVCQRRLLLLAGCGVLAAPEFAVAGNVPDAVAPIQALCDTLLVVMKAGRKTPFTHRFETLAPAMDGALNMGAILQVAVGLRWPSLTRDQQSQLQSAFRDYTVATYVANFDNYSGDSFKVFPQLRAVGDGDQIVHTDFVPSSGDPHAIDYVMRKAEGTWKAVDVLLDGTISRVAVLRSEFRHILIEGGFQALLTNLKQKTADLFGATTTM